jgi:hypothetical protein
MPGEHVSAPRGGEIGRRVGVDCDPPLWGGDHRIGAIKENKRATLPRGDAGPIDFLRRGSRKSGELGFMRRQHDRRLAPCDRSKQRFAWLPKNWSMRQRRAPARVARQQRFDIGAGRLAHSIAGPEYGRADPPLRHKPSEVLWTIYPPQQ